tara:strand:- start:378 stop:1244 length:867 start_codon:yes stop_codon:yes gene_type:complete
MRRGKLNKLSFLLIIISALFTVVSYISDQLVINFENKLRILDSKYQNLSTDIKSINSTSSKIDDIQIKMESFVSSEVLKRNIYLKQLMLLENSKEKLKLDNEYKELFSPGYGDAMIEDIKFQIIKGTRDFITDMYEIINDLYMLENDLFVKEITFFSIEKFTNQLLDKSIYLNNKNNLGNGDFDEFTNKLYDNDIVYSLDLLDWVYFRNYKMAYLETINKSYSDLTRVIDEIDENQAKMESRLEIIFLSIKKNKNFINYFILTGIISQILTLFFLLLLFKNLIKGKIL